eukprot:CAMPEP_0203759486 /NCGR_PEP_ID=MMETSP0098-20131031/12544_1 /ASSEMBLY_ACC=CAM_ASM_000208 /TAXON_ID=96639 /ORGANISM=" , Strain NY0313808BC1" /LENGTH=1115 /DNA_ID=CAMNT_0050652489 /DNA_START=81 /DNA_END=3428 /DNA_ORIENTATION=-
MNRVAHLAGSSLARSKIIIWFWVLTVSCVNAVTDGRDQGDGPFVGVFSPQGDWDELVGSQPQGMVVKGEVVATGGTFTMAYNGASTAPIAFNATSVELKKGFVDSFPGLAMLKISQPPMNQWNTRQFLLTFPPELGDSPQVAGDGNELTGGGEVTVSVVEVVKGMVPDPGFVKQEILISGADGGGIYLIYDGTKSELLDFEAEAARMKEIIEGFTSMTVDVAREKTGGEVKFSVFSNKPASLFEVDGSYLFGSNPAVTVAGVPPPPLVQEVVIEASGGSFTISYKGLSTPQLFFDSSAIDFQMALESLPNIVSTSVTRSQLAGGWMFTITMVNPSEDVDLLGIDTTNLVGTGIVQTPDESVHEVQMVSIQNAGGAGSGSFLLSVTVDDQTLTTMDLAYNLENTASAVDVASALEMLPGIGAVDVTKEESEYPGELTYQITFKSISGDIPELSVDSSNLAPWFPVFTLTKVQAGPTDVQDMNEVQSLDVSATGGTFFLGFRGEFTIDFMFDSSALDLKVGLESLNSVGEVSVSRLTIGENVFRYDITFLEPRGDIPLLEAISSFTGDTDYISINESVPGALAREIVWTANWQTAQGSVETCPQAQNFSKDVYAAVQEGRALENRDKYQCALMQTFSPVANVCPPSPSMCNPMHFSYVWETLSSRTQAGQMFPLVDINFTNYVSIDTSDGRFHNGTPKHEFSVEPVNSTSLRPDEVYVSLHSESPLEAWFVATVKPEIQETDENCEESCTCSKKFIAENFRDIGVAIVPLDEIPCACSNTTFSAVRFSKHLVYNETTSEFSSLWQTDLDLCFATHKLGNVHIQEHLTERTGMGSGLTIGGVEQTNQLDLWSCTMNPPCSEVQSNLLSSIHNHIYEFQELTPPSFSRSESFNYSLGIQLPKVEHTSAFEKKGEFIPVTMSFLPKFDDDALLRFEIQGLQSFQSLDLHILNTSSELVSRTILYRVPVVDEQVNEGNCHETCSCAKLYLAQLYDSNSGEEPQLFDDLVIPCACSPLQDKKFSSIVRSGNRTTIHYCSLGVRTLTAEDPVVDDNTSEEPKGYSWLCDCDLDTTSMETCKEDCRRHRGDWAWTCDVTTEQGFRALDPNSVEFNQLRDIECPA